MLRRTARAIRRAVRHAGLRHRCPCCGGHWRRWVARPEFGIPDLECPRCASWGRHRALWLFLRDQTDLLSAPLRVLHVAPEPMLLPHLRAARNLAEYVTADLRSPLADVRVDVTAMPFPDARFDAVLCGHVLEHVTDDAAAMRELRRVLRPGGWAVVDSPVDPARAATYEDPAVADPAQRLRAFHQPDHVRVYGRDYPDRLRAAGLEVEVVPYAQRLGASARGRYGLVACGPVHLCRRARDA